MKNNSMLETDAHIFRIWDQEGLSIPQIAEREIPRPLSLKTVRNIVYGGRGRITNEHHRKIYSIFRVKFLELQEVSAAIRHAYENQPPRRYTEKQIRVIINRELERRSVRSTVQNEAL